MRTDLEIKQDVLEELIWQPLLEEKLLCIEVKYGVVRLSGTVNNLAEKKVVENATSLNTSCARFRRDLITEAISVLILYFVNINVKRRFKLHTPICSP